MSLDFLTAYAQSAGLPSFAVETNGMDVSEQQLAVVEAPAQKSWERPLTIPEIRKSSNNWSLASDAGLLLYLQEFSQKMMTKTSELEKQMDSLVHDAKSADSRAHNTFNDFLMLANTQFIENRVYDDSEDVDGGPNADKDKKENQTKTREQREAEVIPRVIQALTLGINVLDTGFEQLDANAGNSDSEDEDPTYKAVDPILEAKDLYAHRSLPYIIGTPAFMQDDDVGLMDISDEEEEDVSSQEDTLSESEKSDLSDSEYSDTETESEMTGGRPKQMADTTATSTNKSGSEDSDTGLFDDEEEEQPEEDSQPRNFQDELAAKLGGGAAKGASNVETEVTDEANRNRSVSEDSKTSSQESSKKGTRRKKLPMDGQKKSKKKRSPSKTEDDNLFGEQPGEEEAEDDPFGKKGLFSSSGGGLFDDDKEDEGGLFDDKTGRRDVTSDHVYEDIVTSREDVKPGKKAPPGGVPLFGAGAAQEDELFGGSAKISQEGDSAKPDDSSSGGLFDSQEDDGLFSEPSKPAAKKEAAKPKTKKQVDLFGEGDDSDLFGESQQPTPPKRKIPAGGVNVFGASSKLVGGQSEPPPLDGGEEGDEEGMYVNTMVGAGRSKQANHGAGGGLFDNVDEDLFGTPPPRPAEKPSAKNEADKLFADDDDEDLFAAPPPLPRDESKVAAKKNQGLFDDIEETGEDDLFAASSKPKEASKKKPAGGVALFGETDIFGSPPKSEGESPPPQVARKQELSPQSKANRSQNTLSLFNDDDEKDEDLFAAPPALPPKKDQLDPASAAISKDEQMSRRRTKSKSIFDDEAILFGLKNEENPGVDLFGANTPVPHPKQSDSEEKSSSPRKRTSSGAPTTGLFSDGDEAEDDLFSGGKSATAPRGAGVKAAVAKEKEKEKKKKKSTTLPAKGGLFGDDEEEDDLFGEGAAKKKKEKKKVVKKEDKKEKKKEVKEEKKDEEKKVKESVDDPLGGAGLAAAPISAPSTAPQKPTEDAPPVSSSSSAPAPKQTKKPPAGAVSMFGGMDPSSLTKKKIEPEIDEDFENKVPVTLPKPTPKPAAKPAFSPSSPSSPPLPLFGSSPPPAEDSPDYAVVTPRIRSVTAPKGKSASKVGKLQANMQIDPNALKPGAAPPQRAAEPVPVGFDQPAVAKTLDVNNTKTRARVSAKRRPPSRKSLHAAAAASSNPALWGDSSTGDAPAANEDFQDFTKNFASDEPDMAAAAAPAVKSKSEPPPAAVKPKKQPSAPAAAAKSDLFNSALFDDISNSSMDASAASQKSDSRREERPFSIEGESELFGGSGTKPAASQPRHGRTQDLDDSSGLFSKPQTSLDASMDDIFSSPPVLGQSSKQSSIDPDPTYEDIFASGPETKSKRSTLTDLAVDEDLFGGLGTSLSKDSSTISVDDELFGTPALSSATTTPSTTAASTPTATKPKKKKSAKKAAMLEDDDLFAEKPKKAKTKAARISDTDLFGDTTDIFADVPAAKPKEKKKKKTPAASAISTEDSIFKDVQGDDIFAEPLSSTKPKKTKSKKKAAKDTSDSIFDTDAPNIFDDPLNAMNT